MPQPWLLDLAMRNPRLTAYRHSMISAATGQALEIGTGSELNLPLYGSAVDQVYGIDPSPELRRSSFSACSDTRARANKAVLAG